MSTVLAHTFTHYDTSGTKWQVKFFTSSLAFVATEKEFADPFFELTWEGDRIKKGRLDVYAVVQDSAEIYVQDIFLTHAILYKDDVQYWYGVPYNLGREISEGPYPFVRMYSFRDPIRDGKKDKESVETYTNFVDIVLGASSSLIPLNTYPAWYVSGKVSTNEDIFHELFIDNWVFRDIGEDAENESDDTAITYDQTLEYILQLFDAYLIQWEGAWHLYQHDFWPGRSDLTVFQYSLQGRFEYDKDGNQLNGGVPQGLSTDSRISAGTGPTDLKLLPSSTSYLEKSFVQATYKYNHRNKESALIRFPPDGFTLLAGQTTGYTVPHRPSNPGGDSFYFKAEVSADPLSVYDDKVKASPQVTVKKTTTSTGYDVYWNGSIWTSTVSKVSLPDIPGVRQGEFAYSRFVFDGVIDFKTVNWQYGDELTITIQPLLIGGNEQATFFENVEFGVVADTTDEDADGDENSNEITYSLSLESGASLAAGESFELPDQILGVGPNEISRGSVRYYDSTESDYLRVPEQWNRILTDNGLTKIAELSLQSLLQRIQINRKIIRADFYNGYNPLRLFLDENGTPYIFERGKLSGRRGEWQVYLSQSRFGQVVSGSSYSFNQNGIGYVPGTFAPRQYRTSQGIRASRIEENFDVFKAAFSSDGSTAPTEARSGGELLNGSVGYSTTAGDTLPYFYERLGYTDNLNNFTSGTDDWSAATATTLLLFSSQSRLGAIENGLLQWQMTGSPAVAQEFAIEKNLVDQEFTGYFKCEVFIPQDNGTTQGVKIVAGTQSTSTLTTGEWVPLGLLNSDPAKIEIKGTDAYGAVSYIPTFEDIIRVRAVSFTGNIFEYTNGVITNYDPQNSDWTENADILIGRNVVTGEFVNFGFVTSVDGSGYPVAVDVNDSYLNSDVYQVVGRWQKTIVSISGDVLTTGTLNAGLVSITNLDTTGTQVIRSDTEPTQRPDTTNLQGGDIWIDTNDGDRIYTYNPYPFDVWVETLTAISGSNIVTGTIDASLVTVSNIDADNITTGTLDASQVTITNFSAGNEVIRSSTEPATRADASALQDGDVWIDTDDGNRPYVYAGYPTEAFQEALTVISGNNITTGTIDASSVTISNLSTSDVSGSTVTINSASQPTTRGDSSALQDGDIWIDTDDGNKPYIYIGYPTDDFVAAYTSIDGGDIETGTITANKLTVTNLNAVSTQTGALTVDGTLTVSTGGSIAGSNYSFTDAGGTIAGWNILAGTLSSSSTAGVARIYLSQANKRISIISDSDAEIVAMGYLDGLAKNDGSGNFPTGTYGFWAKSGDKLEIDGDVDYVDGDFIVQANGVLKSSNYSAGTAGFQISGSGDAEFNSVTVRGNIQAGSGSNIDGTYVGDSTITAAKIDTGDLFAQQITIGTGGYIQSTGYTDNTAGFRLNADGTALFNNVEVGGAIQTKQITLYATDFSLDNDFANFNTLMLATTHAGESDALEVTIDTGSSERYIRLPTANGRTTFQAGKDYTVSFKYYIASGQTVQQILVGTEDIYDLSLIADVQDAWTTASFNLLQPDGNQLRFYAYDGYTTTYTSTVLEYFYIKDVVISELSRVDGGYIIANSITADKIAVNTITASEIAANTITASQIAAGTITTSEIAAGTITGSNIAADTITAANISAATITTDEIASGTITTGNIAAGAITAGLIATNTITATQIAAGTITATQLATDSVTADKINVTNLAAVSGTMGALSIDSRLTIGAGGDIYFDNVDNRKIILDDEGVTIQTDDNGLGYLTLRDPGATQTYRFSVDSGGYLLLSGLPTTNPAGTNRLWSDSGTIKIT